MTNSEIAEIRTKLEAKKTKHAEAVGALNSVKQQLMLEPMIQERMATPGMTLGQALTELIDELASEVVVSEKDFNEKIAKFKEDYATLLEETK